MVVTGQMKLLARAWDEIRWGVMIMWIKGYPCEYSQT
jgi:hypothetical protein